MKVADLFSAEMEPALKGWITGFTLPTELLAAMHQLHANLNSQSIQGVVEDGAVIIGPVHISDGSVVRAQAIIRGPAVVGRGVIIHSHVEIQSGSFIGSKCVIGHGCTVIESMLMNNAVVAHSAFVRNSIVGFGSIIGPSAILGAERAMPSTKSATESLERGVIVGDYSTIGANSILIPGTIVGARTVIGEGVLAEGVYEADQRVICRQQRDISRRRD
jgi:bifunctional UDP-N-acetylglucosamine pyrophosphorylase/glucosamine-1-phosphate N-acetyltransferase